MADKNDDDITVESESYLPGGWGTPNYYRASDSEGNEALGATEEEAADNLRDSRGY